MMSKHFKRVILSVLCLLAITCCAFLAACSDGNGDGGNDPNKQYSVTIIESDGATVTADKTKAKKGETVTLTYETNYGYTVTGLKLNGKNIAISNGTAVFKMPAAEAKITAVAAITDNKTTQASPETQLTLNSTIAGNTAKSYWAAEYGDSALTVTVYVEDSRVTPEKDGVEVYFGRSGYTYAKLSSINRGVKITADGEFETFTAADGVYKKADNNGITVEKVEPWSKGDKIDGYFVRVSVTYESLGLSEKPTGGLTALPVLSNYTRTLGTTTVYGNYAKTNAGAYCVLADSEWTENEYAGGTGNLGGTNTVPAASTWDLSKDYPADSENFADRKVTLAGHDGNDNNLYFKDTVGKDAYVEATFKFTKMEKTDEKWGKFGLMLYDGLNHQSGFFYYVDAFVGEAGDGVVRGKNLGYNDAIGNWGGWNGVQGGENKYSADKPITLGMAYSDDVVSLWLIENNNKTMLMQQVHTKQGDYSIGIKSFGVGIEVTNYMVYDAESEEFAARTPEIVKQDIDTLFAGDSYMDFWKIYGLWNTLSADMTVEDEDGTRPAKLVNRGIGGTQVPLWSSAGMVKTLSLSYNPDQIVFHIGVNDIDSPASPDEVYTRLQNLFATYHSTFPQAQIYWVSLIPNNFYINNGGTYNDNYKTLNNKVKEYVKTHDFVTYIDVETAFTAEDGGARRNHFMNDGLHLNAVYGYPLWLSIIKDALGYTPAGKTESDVFGNDADRVATPAWSYGTNGTVAEINKAQADFGKTVNVEESIYAKGVYATDFLFEAELRSSGRYNADDWSKVGVALVNDDVTVLGYFETNKNPDTNASNYAADGKQLKYASLVARGNAFDGTKVKGVADWNWNNQAGGAIAQRDITTTFSKIAIAKRGDTVYLLVDGELIASKKFDEVKAGSKFHAAVTGFNRNIEIKSIRTITDTAVIDGMLVPTYHITLPSIENIEVVIDSLKAKEGDNVSFELIGTNASSVDKVYAVYDSEEHEITPDNGAYKFVMPDANVTIKITVRGGVTVTLDESLADKVAPSVTTLLVGDEVTFSATQGWYIKKLFANGKEIAKDGNVYKLTVTENVTITGEVNRFEKGMIFDGELTADEGWTQDILDTGAYFSGNGLPVMLYGFNSAEGVRIAAVINHNTPVTERLQELDREQDSWHLYLNLEIRLNNKSDDGHSIQTTTWKGGQEYKTRCTPYWKTVENAAGSAWKYTSVCELVVDHSVCETNADMAVPIALGGVWQHGFQWLGGYNDNVLRYTHTIGKNGLTATGDEHKKLYLAEVSATLDGELTDSVWTEQVKANTQSIVIRGASISFMGVKDTNGVLLGVTVDHTTAPDARCQEVNNKTNNFWFYYMGPEFRLNNKDLQIASSTLGQAIRCNVGIKSVKHASENRWTTTFEMFVPYTIIDADGTADIPLALGGVFENGFDTMFGSAWGGGSVANSPFTVTSNGIVWSGAPVVEGVKLDGHLNDSVWTETALSSAHTVEYNVTDGKAVINAVKLADGVLVGVRVTSSKSAFATNDAAKRGDWTSYQNVRLNLFAVNHFVTVYAPSINGINNGETGTTKFGSHEVKNADGTYTTTYEIYIPKADYADQDFTGNIALTVITHTTQSNPDTHDFLGQESATPGDWFKICGYITDDGMIGLTA